LAPVPMAPLLNLLVSNIRGARFGDAAAVGWLLFALTLLITAIQKLIFGERKKGK
jgi:ABC-type sugar transport system permease subunit